MGITTDCTQGPTPQHGVVTFDPADFVAAYPMFAAVAPGLLTSYFVLATMIVDNSCSSVVDDAKVREQLLNLLVAHIATLVPTGTNAPGAGSGGAVVGRIASASEGSVSISAEYAASVSQSAAWFTQTQWGALFWQISSPYRSFRYVAPPQCYGPAGAFAGRRGY